MGRESSNFKLPEWATKIATWAFIAVTGAGFSVYMDTAVHTQEIAVLKKNDDRIEATVAQLNADFRAKQEADNEAIRKSSDKLDRLILMMQRKK